MIVIILIDIFILTNVFAGLDDISRWYIDPSQAYPCYTEWENYQTNTTQDKDYEIVKSSFSNNTGDQRSFQQIYQQAEQGHLGKVSPICLNYGNYKDKINTPENQQIITTIAQKEEKVSTLEESNRTIRAQYDSTLLEKIAGQSRERSINVVGAEKAKQELDQNNRNISTFKKEISELKKQLLVKTESVGFITFLKDDSKFSAVEQAYQQASFWYPSIQLTFQFLFLVPLILIALSVHNFAQRKGYGLISLISWHLSVVFFVPLIIKIFEFLQFGTLVEFIFDIASTLFGGLIFLLSYVYILLIPLLGFGIIKFFQKIVFNTKVQAASRVQESRCIQCAKKIKLHDYYCPHCSCYQYVECESCHELTYKYLQYCKQCGHSQEPVSNQ
nr:MULTISPECIES: zinc ribbon domain-containing protein [unclassified Coleofasciculus]